MAPRVLDLCRKPKTFVPPIASRQSREPFSSPLVKLLSESRPDPVNVATFLRSYWGDVHDIAADAALVADIQTDQSLPREAARAAILMRTSQPHVVLCALKFEVSTTR